MKIGINLATNMLRQNLATAIESSGCPPCIVRAVLESILTQAQAAEAKEIMHEKKLLEQEVKDQKEMSERKPKSAKGGPQNG